MEYKKNTYYIHCFDTTTGHYIKEQKGYILELDGILYGLTKVEGVYTLTHIETGLKIPTNNHKHKNTLSGFIENLSFYNKIIDTAKDEYISEHRERFRKTLGDVQIDFYKYIETLKNGWKYTIARANRG